MKGTAIHNEMGYFMTSQGKVEKHIFILDFKHEMVDDSNLTGNINLVY